MGFDSLFTGISGLNAYQSEIDLISNDIANVGTVGFKGQRMTFADQFYQAQQYATAPSQTSAGTNPQDLGLGVRVNSVDTDFSQGGLETTGVNTDLAINGDGFFILRNIDGSTSPAEVFTRDGAFSLNSQGILYDSGSGKAVQGYMADAAGAISANGYPGNVQIPIGLISQATGTGFGVKVGPGNDQNFDMSLGGNLDQTQWQLEEQGVINGTGAGQGTPGTISTTVYDSLGNAHQMYLKFVPDATGATPAAGAIGANAALSGGGNLIANATLNPGQPSTANITVKVTSATTATVSDGTTTLNNIGPGGQTTIDGVTLTLGNYASADVGSTSQYTITAGATTGLPSSVLDASGNAQTPATRWKVEAYFTDGTQIGGQAATAQLPATIGYNYYDQSGKFINTSSSVGTTGAALTTSLHKTGQPPSAADGNQLDVTTWGLVNGNQPVAPTASGSPATGPIGLDYSSITALSSGNGTSLTSQGATYTVSVINQNGYPAGTLSNITIGQDGVVSGAFTNGQTKPLAQLALATFQNEDGLDRVGGNAFATSASSGLPQIGTGQRGRFGAIIAGSLEDSNVSLADEFTKMIVAQRAFEANTRGISTADQNMQTVVNMRASEN